MNWFRCYLKNRKQFVGIGSVTSYVELEDTGVPQGSILGPVLFLVFIIDLCNLKINGTIFSYVEDTAIVYEDFTELGLIKK